MIPIAELTALLPEEVLARLAVEFQVDKANQIRLPGPVVFLCWLNGVVNHPQLSQQLLADIYQEQTGRPVSRSSFAKRLRKLPAVYFAALFTHLYRQLQPQFTEGEQRALRLRIVDATTVNLSAKLLRFGLLGGTRTGPGTQRQVKAVFTLGEEGLPQLLHLCREQHEAGDNAALGDSMLAATAPGDLWVFDKGCSDRHRLLALHLQQAFFLTPHKDQKLRTLQVLWEAPPAAEAAPAEAAPAEAAPAAGAAPYRLLRVARAVFENSQDAASRAAQQRWAQLPLLVLTAERWDQRTQRWLPHVLLTNLPAVTGTHGGPYTFLELLELYRRRWEIETFFKFLKQHLGYRHLLCYHENGIRLLLWMTLIAALLLLWYKRRTGISTGWRSVKFWFAENTRAWTTEALRRALRTVPET